MAMTDKQWKGKVKTLISSGHKLDTLIHTMGVDALTHASEFGDARRIDQLLHAMPKGYRREGFKVWVQMFSPIRWNGDDKIGLASPQTKGFTPFGIEEATSRPFWTLEEAKEQTVKELSPDALRALINKFAKDLNEANDKGEVVRKDGTVKALIKGNIIELKQLANRVLAAAA